MQFDLERVVQGLQRTNTYEIPVPAIREAIINAIVLRVYTNQGRDDQLIRSVNFMMGEKFRTITDN